MRIIHSLLTLTLISLLTTRLTHSQTNLHHPEFSQNEYTGDISEDAALSTLVLTVSATDNDGHAITYSIEGESHNFFYLNPSTGALTVQHVLDRETLSFIEFDVSPSLFRVLGYLLYSGLKGITMGEIIERDFRF